MRISRIKLVVQKLSRVSNSLSQLSAIAGFDGFVDSIVRPIACGDSRNPMRYFENITEFSGFLSDRAGKSCSVELSEFARKPGGNAPIFANALGTLGVSTACIGAFGYPEIENVFNDVSPNCRIIPVAKPGICTALEFADGKVMLALNGEINDMTWQMISQRVGIDSLIHEFQKAKLIGLFNWSETPMANDIWKGILREILPKIDRNKVVIFDFSDCARHKTEEISCMLDTVKAFGGYSSTIISMNENEFSAVRTALYIKDDVPISECGDRIRQRLNSKYLVLHFHDETMGFSEEGVVEFKTLLIENAAISTGAGDNFNAGLCYGILAGFTLMDSIVAASMTSSFYVAHGRSPDISELIIFMNENINQMGGNER